MAQYGLEGYGYSIFASDKAITFRRGAIQGFVTALLRATQLALKEPQDVARCMKEVFPEMDEQTLEKQFRTVIPLVQNAITKAEGLGSLDRDRVLKTWKWTARAAGIAPDLA